jgi:hypothetical protein
MGSPRNRTPFPAIAQPEPPALAGVHDPPRPFRLRQSFCAPFGAPVLDRGRNAHDDSDTRRPSSADQCLGPSRSACPGQGNPGPIRSPSLNRAGPSRLRLGLASRSLAGPLGLVALGRLLPELVSSPGGCDRASRVDNAERADLAHYRGLRSRRLGGRVWPRVSSRRVRHDQRRRREA